jgi:hypothetical protein
MAIGFCDKAHLQSALSALAIWELAQHESEIFGRLTGCASFAGTPCLR